MYRLGDINPFIHLFLFFKQAKTIHALFLLYNNIVFFPIRSDNGWYGWPEEHYHSYILQTCKKAIF